MKLAEIFMEDSGPKGRHFPGGFIPQALRRHEQACKNPGREVARFGEGTKRERWRFHIDPVYSTLCPRITSTRSTSKFYFNRFQYSVGGAVMLDAMTHGQDCT